MYISIGGVQRQCGMPSFSEQTLIWPDVPGIDAPVEDCVITCRDDGFIMREDFPETWLRQTYENDTLVFTNLPEPEPYDPGENPPEPPEPPGEGKYTQQEKEAFIEGLMEGAGIEQD